MTQTQIQIDGTDYTLRAQRPDGAEVAVVILNWNGRHLLEEYLPQVVANTDAIGSVTMADNGSTDDSKEWTHSHFPGVIQLSFSRNHGFAEGYNRVLRLAAEAGFRYVVLLNSDVAPAPGWLRPLYDYMETHPEVAACQPKILSYRNKDTFEYAGASGGFIDRNGYPYCRGRIFDTCEKDMGQYDTEEYIDWASGAAMMVRTDEYNAAGGLDASFFAHMEEIDLCWRMRLRGRKIAVVPSSVVYHLGGGSLPPSDPRKTYLNFRNNLLMLYKNLPARGRRSRMLRRKLLDGVAGIKYLISGNLQGMWAIVRAHRDFNSMKRQIAPRSADDHAACDDQRRPDILKEYYLLGHRRYCRL